MKHLAMIVFILGVSTMAHAETKTACALITQNEAEQFVGSPLAIESKAEPASDDARTSCGFLPKGYSFETAEGPPEPGLVVTVHGMKTADSAKRFFEATFSMANEAKSQAGSPLAKDKIMKLKGVGDAAFLVDRASFHTAFIFILKGSTMTQVQVWKKAGSPVQIATGAARQVVARLQ